MRKILQLVIIFLILFSIFFFKELYFVNDKENTSKKIEIDQQLKKGNNVVKNLKYEISLNENNKYVISSEFSEINNIGNEEIVKMKKVKAIFFDKFKPLYNIDSNTAIYNSYSKNTNFKDNVLIRYLDNSIYSDKLDLDFRNQKIKIFQNVKLVTKNSVTYTDNIDINLITNKIDIYMDDNRDKVEFSMD